MDLLIIGFVPLHLEDYGVLLIPSNVGIKAQTRIYSSNKIKQ